MSSLSISTILQLIVGLGLLNVWLVRSGSETSYRGGSAGNLKEEFAAYGLPDVVFYLVGTLKIGAAIVFLSGRQDLVAAAAAVVAVLMIGALIMHAKVKDPAMKSLPAFLMLVMSAGICAFELGYVG